MKKTIKLTLAVVFVMGATSLFAQKFGRINTQEVISVMPEMKRCRPTWNFAKDFGQIESMNVESTRNCRIPEEFQHLSESYAGQGERSQRPISPQRVREAAQQDSRSDRTSCWPRLSKGKRDRQSGAAGGYLAYSTLDGFAAYFDEASSRHRPA
ncbi:MAG: OmpH family outer membrane protein [Alistipes sp.]